MKCSATAVRNQSRLFHIHRLTMAPGRPLDKINFVNVSLRGGQFLSLRSFPLLSPQGDIAIPH